MVNKLPTVLDKLITDCSTLLIIYLQESRLLIPLNTSCDCAQVLLKVFYVLFHLERLHIKKCNFCENFVRFWCFSDLPSSLLLVSGNTILFNLNLLFINPRNNHLVMDDFRKCLCTNRIVKM